MFFQRSALLCLQIADTQDNEERENKRCQLREIIEMMKISHNALINGDASLNLSAKMSSIIKAMYFEAPIYLDRLFHNYITEVEALLQLKNTELTQDNLH